MAYKIDRYVRTQPPLLAESEKNYLQDELRKLEKALQTIYDAIQDIDKRLAALE